MKIIYSYIAIMTQLCIDCLASYIPCSKNISSKNFGELQQFTNFFANFHYFHGITFPMQMDFNFPKLLPLNFLQSLFAKLFTAEVFYYTVASYKGSYGYRLQLYSQLPVFCWRSVTLKLSKKYYDCMLVLNSQLYSYSWTTQQMFMITLRAIQAIMRGINLAIRSIFRAKIVLAVSIGKIISLPQIYTIILFPPGEAYRLELSIR